MALGPKRPFTVSLRYFKDTGKLYASGNFTADFSVIADAEGQPPYMEEVYDHVRVLRAQKKLPGLVPTQ